MRRGPDRARPVCDQPSGQRREAVGRLDHRRRCERTQPSRSDTDFARRRRRLRSRAWRQTCALKIAPKRYLYMSSGVFVSVVCPTSTR